MDRGLFSQLRFGRVHYIVAAAILLILMVGIVLVQSSLFERTALPSLGPVAQVEQPANDAKAVGGSTLGDASMSAIRPADAYSAQLAQLAERARQVSRFGQASAYALQLDRLSQQGRAAFTANRIPVTANAYSNYLDNLRRLGQVAYAKQAFLTMDANAYVNYLDNLRRLGQVAYAKQAFLTMDANAYVNYLDNLRRLGKVAYTKQAFLTMDANGYVNWLDELRRMGVEAYVNGKDE
jgi:hypothetical protein